MTWPTMVPFDPAQGTASPAVEALLKGPGSAGSVLVLAAGPEAHGRGWAARSAIALARAFAARGESVVLADLSLSSPELHSHLGTDNEEGLTDVFLFGASLDHVLHAIPGEWFRLIPASPYTPDPSDVLGHARWRSLNEEIAQRRCKLITYLPVTLDGAREYLARADYVVVLAERSEMEQVRAGLAVDTPVLGVLHPLEPQPVPPSPPRLDEQDFEKIRIPKDGAREALIADLRSRQRAALSSPEPALTPLPHEEELEPSRTPGGESAGEPAGQPEPLFTLHTQAQPTPRRSRAWLAWLMLLVLVVALGAGAWYIWQTRLARTSAAPQSRRNPALQAAPPSPAPPVAGTSVGALPYSVAIASYQDLEVALGRLDQLSEQAPELPFYIGPIAVQDRIFFRIMAGPLPDSGSAVLLRDTLIVKRIKTISSGWDVLNAPYAFLIGQHASRAEAEAQQEDAVRKGVPTYIVMGTNPDSTQQFNVYAGAYTGPGDAEFMRPILKSAGFPDNLVEKNGSMRS